MAGSGVVRGDFVFRRHLEPIEHFDPATMQRAGDIVDYRPSAPRCRFDGYVNNFLFLVSQEPNTTLDRLNDALGEPSSIIPSVPLWSKARHRHCRERLP